MEDFDIPDWVMGHRQRTWAWFQTVQVENSPANIRLCTKGDKLLPSPTSGLGWSALGCKLAQILDFFSLADGDLRQEFIDRINSFQCLEGPFAGYYQDEALLSSVDRWSWRRWQKIRDYDARRAETRQAIVTLKGLDAAPRAPLGFMMRSEEEIVGFLDGLPWDTNPWHCGSHAAHLIVFLKTNADFFGQQADADALIPVVFRELDKRLNSTVGSWFEGDPPSYQKINAAMKVYSGYEFVGARPPAIETLLDYALDAAIAEGACNHVDIMYVLQVASRHTDYRQAEIRRLAYNALETIRQHIQPDGGLCYSYDGTQRRYYGATVSKGLKGIGDLHGTKLFSWSIALAADILGWRNELGWKLPVT